MPDSYVYIMASRSRTLYTGVTNNLERRVSQHKLKLVPGFTARYNINRLIYYEPTVIFVRPFGARNRSRGGCGRRKSH